MTEANIFGGGAIDIIGGEQVRVTGLPDMPMQSVDFYLPSIAQAKLATHDLAREITPFPDPVAAHSQTELEIAMTIAQGVNLGAAAGAAETQALRRVKTAERAVRENGIADEAWLADNWRGPQFKYEMFASLTEQVQLRLQYAVIEFVAGAKPYDERTLAEGHWRRTTAVGTLSGVAPGFVGAMVSVAVPGETAGKFVAGIGTAVGLIGLTELRNHAAFGPRDKSTRTERKRAQRINKLAIQNMTVQNSLSRASKVVPKFEQEV